MALWLKSSLILAHWLPDSVAKEEAQYYPWLRGSVAKNKSIFWPPGSLALWLKKKHINNPWLHGFVAKNKSNVFPKCNFDQCSSVAKWLYVAILSPWIHG